MADLIQIANLSLSRIGTRSTIADLAEDSPEARAFNIVYEQARDETLEAVDWGFARGRRYLADLGKPPVDWQFRYAYPNDCLKIRSLYQPLAAWRGRLASIDSNAASEPVPYEVAIDQDGQGNDLKVIYCDQPRALAFYTRRVSNTALFPPGFLTALSWACGAQMAVPLAGNTQLMQACLTMWRDAVGSASAADANEGFKNQNVTPDWIAQR
jgi:hypothetical protein